MPKEEKEEEEGEGDTRTTARECQRCFWRSLVRNQPMLRVVFSERTKTRSLNHSFLLGIRRFPHRSLKQVSASAPVLKRMTKRKKNERKKEER